VIKILQGSVVTQTMLGGLTIHPPVANFLVYMCQKLWKLVESRQSYYNESHVQFFGPPCTLCFKKVHPFGFHSLFSAPFMSC